MKNQPVPRTPEEIKKDTSLPGREEEVIVNTEEQQRVTNTDEENENISPEKVTPQTISDDDVKGEKTFKEGLGNNSDTGEL